MQPAGAGQVSDQVQAAGELDVEELAVPTGADELAAGDRGGRWVVRLQGADRGHLEPVDAVTGGALAQVGGEGFHLWQFGHGDNGSLIGP